jgi:hypothetical protein
MQIKGDEKTHRVGHAAEETNTNNKRAQQSKECNQMVRDIYIE